MKFKNVIKLKIDNKNEEWKLKLVANESINNRKSIWL